MRGRQHSATLRLCGKQTQGQCKTIKVIQGDITTLAVDAIVNAANEVMLGWGGIEMMVDYAFISYFPLLPLSLFMNELCCG